MSASIKDVAIKSGVSVATVSHVINNTRFVSEATKNKILTAMEELKYVPNSMARSLRTNKTKTVALLIPDISNFFFTEVAEAIERVLSKKGYSLFLCNTGESIYIEKKQIMLMSSQLVSGIIIAPTSRDFDYRSMFTDVNYPIVFIDRKTYKSQADVVMVDGKTATYDAVSSLIEKGHRRIGYIAGRDGLSTTDERLSGYLEAIRENGLQIDEKLIKRGDSRHESGYQLTEELVNTDATAIFVSNNLMAVGALKCLSNKNISIPESMAVIGFDDYNWSTITNPPLSTIKQPVAKLGAMAAELVLKRIENPEGPYTEYNLPAEFIVRKSC
ncbi:LacI family transcriptional regulator [Ruminiclostridium sufflavum DSM 19573]|uniref:LacI family transcriptional regulator n=1 Tax=Ruminiclostridium sufflavum DSM 19573 TaxID=1121337 RepID=A0A318XK21_9FIRM|nr:LacI family DNA-binding transcriptional regulator [Ruminiclostridium sufflavum]PYG85767.1 LacI family transcriptional regulator [Ruminiclostridium sufflavum DSM 19573]